MILDTAMINSKVLPKEDGYFISARENLDITLQIAENLASHLIIEDKRQIGRDIAQKRLFDGQWKAW